MSSTTTQTKPKEVKSFGQTMSEARASTDEALHEGLMAGGMVFVPAMGALYMGLQNAKFRSMTNWQSRTAMVVMPTLFAIALVAEMRVVDQKNKRELDDYHKHQTVEWAERQVARKAKNLSDNETSMTLGQLYQLSIEKKNYRIVPGNELSWSQKTQNYIAENPIKLLVGFSIPGVAWVYAGADKNHETLSRKILQTRVLGQTMVIATMLGIMVFKEIIDSQGRFVTQASVDQQIEEMKQIREDLFAQMDKSAEKEKPHKLVRPN